MSNLKSLVFYSKHLGSNSDLLWLSRNVDFIYSCVMSFRKTKSSGLQKLNVFLENKEEPWDGVLEQGIAETKERFDPEIFDSGAESFELALSGAANSALLKMSNAGLLSRLDVEEIVKQVSATGFVYSYVIKKLRRDSDRRRFALTIESGFGKVLLCLVDQALNRTYRLFTFWPSPWIVMIKLKSVSFLEDGRLSVSLLWQKENEELRFGMRIFEAIPEIQMLEVDTVIGTNQRCFLFDIP